MTSLILILFSLEASAKGRVQVEPMATPTPKTLLEATMNSRFVYRECSNVIIVGNGTFGNPTMDFRCDGRIFHNGNLITTDKDLVGALKRTLGGKCK